MIPLGFNRTLFLELNDDSANCVQAAYGILCEVESHPFPLDTMLFMDWRASHLSGDLLEKNSVLPTFLYAMPFTENLIFLEETSLVGLFFNPFEHLYCIYEVQWG